MASSTSFERLLAALEEAIQWVESLGLRVGVGRFGEYERFYAALLRSVREENSAVLLGEDWAQRALDGLVAAQELILIRNELSRLPQNQLVPRLRKYVTGASAEAAENPATGTSQARNLGFELVLAARLAAGGIEPVLPEEGDIAVEVVGLPVHIECKRPQSMAGLEEAVGKAADQLSARANKAQVQPRGVIGISIGKMVHEGTQLVVTKSADDAQEVLNQEAVRFVQANERLWQRDDWPFVHLVIVDVSAPVHVTATDQWLWASGVSSTPSGKLTQVNRGCNGCTPPWTLRAVFVGSRSL